MVYTDTVGVCLTYIGLSRVGILEHLWRELLGTVYRCRSKLTRCGPNCALFKITSSKDNHIIGYLRTV